MGYIGDSKNIRTYVDEIDAWAEKKGWTKPALATTRGMIGKPLNGVGRTTEPRGVKVHLVLSKLALVIEEVGEAVTEARHGRWGIWYLAHHKDGSTAMRPWHHRPREISAATFKPEGFVVELADIIIRVMQLAGALGLPLQQAMEEKLRYNQTRPYRHGKKA